MPFSFTVSDLAIELGIQNDGDAWQTKPKTGSPKVFGWMAEFSGVKPQVSSRFLVSLVGPVLIHLQLLMSSTG